MAIFDQLKALAGTAAKTAGSVLSPQLSNLARLSNIVTSARKATTLSNPVKTTDNLFTTRTSTPASSAAKTGFTLNSSVPKAPNSNIAKPTMIGPAPIIQASPAQPPVALNAAKQTPAANIPVATPQNTPQRINQVMQAPTVQASNTPSGIQSNVNALQSALSASNAPIRDQSSPLQAATINQSQEQNIRPSQIDSQMASLRQAYMDSLTPTNEETETSRQLRYVIAKQASLGASRDLGLAEISNQPITLSLIRGQQQALQNQAAAQMGALGAQAKPLEAQLADLQAMREARANAAKTAIGFAESDAERAQKASELSMKANAPIEVDGSLVRLNPATGSYETVYQGAPKTGSQPSNVQEYLFARDNGFSGTFLDYQRAKDEATNQGSNALPTSYREWQLAGSPGAYSDWINRNSGKPLSGDAAKVVSIAETMVPEINQLKQAFQADYKGALTGILSGTNRELVKLVDQVADKVGRLRSGGAINKDEEARFKRQIASFGDLMFGDPQQAMAALDGLVSEAQSVSAGMRGQTTPLNNQSMGDPLDQALDSLDFKRDLGKSLNGQLPKEGSTTSSNIGTGVITGYGSPYWKPGLDFVLQGGPNAPVPSPVSGTVVFTGKNGGFGNQVKIRLDDGTETWISHLNGINAKKGQRIERGALIGLQGNTGNVIKSKGGTGTHLDITMKKPDGTYYKAEDVARFIGAA